MKTNDEFKNELQTIYDEFISPRFSTENRKPEYVEIEVFDIAGDSIYESCHMYREAQNLIPYILSEYLRDTYYEYAEITITGYETNYVSARKRKFTILPD